MEIIEKNEIENLKPNMIWIPSVKKNPQEILNILLRTKDKLFSEIELDYISVSNIILKYYT